MTTDQYEFDLKAIPLAVIFFHPMRTLLELHCIVDPSISLKTERASRSSDEKGD